MNDRIRPNTDDARKPAEARDDVAALLRAAGQRAEVPGERWDRVRAAARTEWTNVVSERSRKRRRARGRWAAVAAAAVLTVAIALRFAPFDIGDPSVESGAIHVDAITGSGWIDDGGGRRALSRGDRVALAAGDDSEVGFETAPDGRAALRLATGHALRVDRLTRLSILDDRVVRLDHGRVYVDSGHGDDSRPAIEVRTSLGVVREIGTQFEVRLVDEALRVRLREGAATVSRGDRSFEVTAGDELRIHADGSVTRGTVIAHDSSWNWLSEVTTVPSMDGTTARAFLDWVARERGWALRFEPPALADSVATIVLGGTADDLTIDQALDAVLPTCRLDYRVEGGTLVVFEE